MNAALLNNEMKGASDSRAFQGVSVLGLRTMIAG